MCVFRDLTHIVLDNLTAMSVHLFKYLLDLHHNMSI